MRLSFLLKQIVVISMVCFPMTLFFTNTTSSIQEAYKNINETYMQWKRKTEEIIKSDSGKSRYRFNCGNIDSIEIIQHNVGDGSSKFVDIGIINGQKLVIKRLDFIRRTKLNNDVRQLHFLKEILFLDQLDHPGIIKLMGYCVTHLLSEEYQTFPKTSGILAVFEYGESFNVTLLRLNTTQRLNHALMFVDLIRYFQYSPIGPIQLGDFKANSHFLMVDGVIKLIDFDFVHAIEFPCKLDQDNKKSGCIFNATCESRSKVFMDQEACSKQNMCNVGVCSGVNARVNTGYIYDGFLKHLLKPEHFPENIKEDIAYYLDSINKGLLDPNEMVQSLTDIIKKNEQTLF